MYTLTTSIEIAAPPATVRNKFLDFSSIPTYTPNGFVHSIAPTDPAIAPANLKPGDKLNCAMGYGKMKFSPVVVENTGAEFSWKGSVPGVFTGVHAFRFEEIPSPAGSTVEAGARTKLVHEEVFTGLLSGLMGDGWLGGLLGMHEQSKKGFEGFNADFKKWVESSN
ncbi:hypothetical protein BDW62DRAFT_205128 [Aspergillus aurantiobrunneus]